MSTPQPEFRPALRPARRIPARTIAAVSAAMIAFALLTSPAQAAAIPYPKPSRTLPAALDVVAPYQKGTLCLTVNQPGAVAFAKLLNTTYGTHAYGILRQCGQSEHSEGRALDWMIDSTKPANLALANALTRWLVAPDAQGRPGAMARRFGINYIIFNRQEWGSWAPERGWFAYTGSSPHTDHIHFTFNWDGAYKRTSWWSGVAVTTPLTGPRRSSSAPSYPRDVTSDGHADVVAVDASGGALRVYPTTGAGGWKTAVVSGSGWDSYAKVLTAGTWDDDAISDVMVQDTAGGLFLRHGKGNGTFAAPVRIGTGWTVHNLVIPVGDFDGDKFTDVIARRADGALFLYSGTGLGGFVPGTGRQIGSGWNVFDAVFSPGDFDGDGHPDLIGRTPDGAVYLYRGNGVGGWRLPRTTVAAGWEQYTALTSPGDFGGDGRSDVLARSADGRFWLLPGDGRGGVGAAKQVGTGWNMFSTILP